MIPYKEILKLSYTEAKTRYPQSEGSSHTQKVIVFKNTPELPTFAEGSDIIIYYDMINETPLLLVERIPKGKVKRWGLRKKVKKISMQLDNYVAVVNTSKDKMYYDINVIKTNIYASLEE